ncbi:MAG: DUF1122 family protein [candidate division WOR-3 bacterium]|nr:MAG: DUF1122 family protein [candidate division WOR-3 bacterium]
MVDRFIKELEHGLVVNGFTVKGEPIKGARYREEYNMRVNVCKGERQDQVCCAKIFTGRLPYYRPWIELFDIYGCLHMGGKDVEYFDSKLEQGILRFFADMLEPGENFFVEYYRDQETRRQLQSGVPAPATRLGALLYERGFTWFKDWYYPEGFLEGEPKLQGEKPLNTEEKNRQNTRLLRELDVFIDRRNNHHPAVLLQRAYDRAEEIISKYRAY